MIKIIKKLIAVFLIISINSAVLFATFDTYSYPEGFIDEDNDFNAQIVIGANSTDDIIAANLLLDVLTSDDVDDDEDDNNGDLIDIEDVDFDDYDENDRIRVYYRRDDNIESDGDRIDALDDNAELNYGETLEEASDGDGLDDDTTDLLQDESFDNGINNEDYTQTLFLLNGEFNYALRDGVDNVEDITDGIYYDNNDEYAQYVIDFDSPIDLSDSDDLEEDMVGEVITIMGSEFTIVSIDNEGSDLESIELVGGSNKITIEEDERRTVEVDGEDYEIRINIVNEDKVSLEVDGESASIDIYDVDDVSGISIAVADLIDSDRDTINGYAELVVGGQKILLEDDNSIIQVNDEDIDDIYDDVEAVSDFSDNDDGMDEIIITYRVTEETLLEEGDSLDDILFDRFSLVYDGLNDAEYETISLDVSSDDNINVDGVLFSGNDFNRDLIYTTSTDGTNGVTYIRGEDNEDRIFTSASDIGLYLPGGISQINADVFEFDFSEPDIEGSGILASDDTDEQFMYVISNVDSSELTVDVDEIFDDQSDEDLEASDFLSEIDVSVPSADADDVAGTLQIDKTQFGEPIIAFENDMIMDLANVESSGVGSYIVFFYDSDINGDEQEDEDENFNVSIGWDAGDDSFELDIDSDDTDFVNSDNADISDDNDDTQIYVTSYGTQIEFDTDDNDRVVIRVPDDQVSADAYVVFGEGGTSTDSVVVDGDQLEDEIENLEDDDYEVTDIRVLNGDDEDRDEDDDLDNLRDLDEDEEDNDNDNDEYEVQELPEIVLDTEIDSIRDKIIIGGPAINEAAAEILGLNFPTYGPRTELEPNQAVIRFYDQYDSLLIYGYEYKDTLTAVERLLEVESIGEEVFISN